MENVTKSVTYGGGNSQLAKARNKKAIKQNDQDEYYTQLSDIEKELKNYKNYFKDKVIYCNCDDPYESNFFKYFVLNFNTLKLKKLITTCYIGSNIIGTEFTEFIDKEKNKHLLSNKKAYKVIISELKDMNHDGSENLCDVREILKNQISYLDGDGDFRSEECIELLKQADIIITNPPFSLFRDYIKQLIQYNKKFIVLSNPNALHYKEVFPLLQNDQIWLGYKTMGSDMLFDVSKKRGAELVATKKEGSAYKIIDGVIKGRSRAVWITNIDTSKRHSEFHSCKIYTPHEYPKYDNYDAIEVAKVEDIPRNYKGIMGVPDSFLDHYNPTQFEILGCTQRGCHDKVPDTKKYNDYYEIRQNGKKTGSTGKKTNENANLEKNDGKHNYYINATGHIVQSTYSRIFIRWKDTTYNENLENAS